MLHGLGGRSAWSVLVPASPDKSWSCCAPRDAEDVQLWLADASNKHSGHWLVAGAHSLTSRMVLVFPRDEGRLAAQVRQMAS